MKLFGKWRKDSEPEAQAPAFTTPSAAAPAPSTPEPAAISNPSAAYDGPPIGKGRKVLVVDDNEVVLKTFQLKLKTLGFQVLTAKDGSSAVSCARQEKPDLIVLDINFPPDVGSSGLQWDGFNIMEWMGRFKEVSNIPVIIITSSEPAKLKDRAFAAGAVAFFQKPINHEEFLMAVRRVLGQRVPAGSQAAA